MTLSFKSVRKNTLFGLASVALPTLVMFIAYPILIDGIGLKALGVYFIATSLSGIWGALDLGVAASSVKLVPEEIRQGRPENAVSIFVTSLLLYFLLGTVIATGLWIATPDLVILLNISPDLVQQAETAFRIESIKFAVFFVSLALISFLKGLEDFSYSATLMTFLSLATFGGAAVGVTFYEAYLVDICWIGLGATVTVLMAAAFGAAKAMKANGLSFRQAKIRREAIKRIVGYAPYLAVNAISVSTLTLFQRILISTVLGPAAVSAFAIASTLFRRGQVLLLSTFEALTPAIAGQSTTDTMPAVRQAYLKMLRWSGAAATIGAITAFALIEPIAAWWLGNEVKADVTEMVRVLALAGLIFGVVPPGYHLLNGMGLQRLNTGFMLLVPPIFLMAVFGLNLDGFQPMDVIYAHTVAVAGYSITLVFYVERIFWRKHMPKTK